MTFEYVDVVKEAYDAEEVNNLLDHGWRLLGFVKSDRVGEMMYVMGRARSRAPNLPSTKTDEQSC
jgi:hypothetical protein